MSHAATLRGFAAAVSDPARTAPSTLVYANNGGVGVERFAIYRNNVFVGLTRALASRFPACERLVGAEFFTGMARIFAGHRKPTTPLMFQYGDDFPEFIESFAPAASVPYLADIARLEVAISRSYHAKDTPTLSTSSLQVVDPTMLEAMRFVRHPAAEVVTSAFPIGSIWAAQQSGQSGTATACGGETVLVTRPALQVGVHVIPSWDAAFARALLTSHTLARAAQLALMQQGFDFGTALTGLVSLGAFADFQTAEKEDDA